MSYVMMSYMYMYNDGLQWATMTSDDLQRAIPTYDDLKWATCIMTIVTKPGMSHNDLQWPTGAMVAPWVAIEIAYNVDAMSYNKLKQKPIPTMGYMYV